MNTDTGEIRNLTKEDVEVLERERAEEPIAGHPNCRRRSTWAPLSRIKPIDPRNLSEKNRKQLEATGRTVISRNSSCPCGSRKRFKRCCMTTPEN